MEERRLTFGEHLEELRAHVIRGVAYVFLALIACLLFQDELLRVVLWPQRRVAAEGRDERLARAGAELEGALADLRAGKPLAERTPEERAAVGRRVGGALDLLTAGPDGRLNILAPQEAFLAYLKVAFICALFAASPLIAWELWRFVAEGLRVEERHWVRIFGPLSFLCFAGGVLFGYFLLIPISLEYLESYGSPDLIQATIRLDAYLDLFMALTLALGLIFEVPIVLVFLSLIGIVSSITLGEFRRYFLLLATIVAAVVTPTGDPLTLSFVAVPLILLYELGVLLVKLMERKRTLET